MRMGDFKFLGLWKDYYEFMKKEKLGAYRMDQDCFAAVPGLNFKIKIIIFSLIHTIQSVTFLFFNFHDKVCLQKQISRPD